MLVKTHIACSLVLACALPLSTAPSAQQSHVDGLSGDSGRGNLLYSRYCVGCHGREGDGMGENAAYLDPKPRDFTAGVFKCRSTPTGSLPFDSDLFTTIGRGIHASAMPSWIALMPQQRADLVAFIKTFSPRFQQEKPQAVVPIPAETPNTKESADRGKKLYQKMECWKCHGEQGKGNGPSAPTLTDSKDQRIVPYDFTTGERLKCGQTNEDLYRIFMTGLDGTPMPSYLADLKSDEAWDLVHFLRTLQKPTR